MFKIFFKRKKKEEKKMGKIEPKPTEEKESTAVDVILEAVIDGVGVADLNGNITQVNNALARMLGVKSPKDIIGESLMNFLAEREISKVMEGVKSCVTTGITMNFEFIMKKMDGTEFPCMLNASILKDEKGDIVGPNCNNEGHHRAH
jgi:PAS domain S-box-containing protein